MTDQLAETEARFRADPDAGRASPTVTATLANGHARLSAGAFNWEADLPVALGGQNLAPTPTAYLLGALAGCAVALIADTLAPQLGIRVDGLTAVARCRSDARGLLGMDGAAPDLQDITLEVDIDTPDPEEAVERLLGIWRERCPIYLSLRKSSPVSLERRIATPH